MSIAMSLVMLAASYPAIGGSAATASRLNSPAMMIPPAGMALASITVMLWILWSDTIRSRKPSPILYTVRIMLFLVVSGVLILNMIRYPYLFSGSAKAIGIVAAIVGIVGAGYFVRKLVRR